MYLLYNMYIVCKQADDLDIGDEVQLYTLILRAHTHAHTCTVWERVSVLRSIVSASIQG